ncbi:S26 family signal peptidase, partial [Paracoccus sp. APAP_BH8]|uniref:S26 family signal peptidase n=1 Tax=Paracoccus sp. APAP_BH8 TaxID=3110237 RepID=UPI002FD7E641
MRRVVDFALVEGDGRLLRLPQDEVLHLVGLTLDGVRGVSPIAYARLEQGLGRGALHLGQPLALAGMPDRRDAVMAGQRPRQIVGIWETVKTIFWALVIAGVFRTLFFQPFWIPSGSMKDTLLTMDKNPCPNCTRFRPSSCRCWTISPAKVR